MGGKILKPLVISARQSDLARIQAYQVGHRLSQAHKNLDIAYRFRTSLGDQNLNDPLWKMPDKGVFTQDFRRDLINRDCDMVVHSFKDLPIDPASTNTEVVATLPRADIRDMLFIKKNTEYSVYKNDDERLRIFSSSPRRAYNLTPFLTFALPSFLEKPTNLEFVDVRGNIMTRFEKLFSDSGVNGLVVAKAAIDRLFDSQQFDGHDREFSQTRARLRTFINDCRWMVLPLSHHPSAAGQGTLAIEIRSDRDDLRVLLKSVHCDATFMQVMHERKILSRFGGGCHQKIGVTCLTRWYGKVCYLRGQSDSKKSLDETSLEPLSQRGSWPLPQKKDEIQLTPPSENFYFRREKLAITDQQWQEQIRNKSLWIARAEAASACSEFFADHIVWTAGVKSWFKLAKKGIWVNGCADELGEDEDPQIDLITGCRLNWLKLTHQNAEPLTKGPRPIENFPTYRLVPQNHPPGLLRKKYFYWKSGSSFLAAIKQRPQIRQGYHGCGPGNTYKILVRELKTPDRVRIFLSREHWLKELAVERFKSVP